LARPENSRLKPYELLTALSAVAARLGGLLEPEEARDPAAAKQHRGGAVVFARSLK
jgi:hypothetical protein